MFKHKELNKDLIVEEFNKSTSDVLVETRDNGYNRPLLIINQLKFKYDDWLERDKDMWKVRGIVASLIFEKTNEWLSTTQLSTIIQMLNLKEDSSKIVRAVLDPLLDNVTASNNLEEFRDNALVMKSAIKSMNKNLIINSELVYGTYPKHIESIFGIYGHEYNMRRRALPKRYGVTQEEVNAIVPEFVH